jgi:hypothetical protein
LKEQSNFVARGAGGLENKDRLESSWTPTFHKDNQGEDESPDVSPSDSSLKGELLLITYYLLEGR